MLTHLRTARDHTPGWIYTPAVPAFFFTGGYCCGGVATAYHTFCGNKQGGIPMQTTQKWDGLVWTTRADCPLPGRQNLASVYFSEAALLVGGTSGLPLSNTDRFDSRQDLWTNLIGLPPPSRFDHCGVATKTAAYMWCGRDGTFGYLRDNDSFSVNTWTTLIDCPAPARAHASAATANQRLFLFCGNSGAANLFRTTDEFVRAANTWIAKNACPFPARQGQGCFSFPDQCVLAGGGVPLISNCDVYSAGSDSWAASQDLPPPSRQWAGSSSLPNAMAGWITSGEGDAGVRLPDVTVHGPE